MLGVFVGDVVGAGYEGQSSAEIRQFQPGGVRTLVASLHMGVGHLGPRYGMYTDDTQSTLALAASLVERRGLDPQHVASSYSAFFRHQPQRGYPRSAQAVLFAVEQGGDIYATGRKVFEDGSFANGGAMRIAPVGLAFRNAPDEAMHEAVRLAIVSSHVHPDGIDGAWVVAKGVALLLARSPESFDARAFLGELLSASRSHEMQWRIRHVLDSFESLAPSWPRDAEWSAGLAPELAIGSEFQIKATEAVGVALLAFAVHWRDPVDAIAAVIGYGGDTDTTACIAGALLGALHTPGPRVVPRACGDGAVSRRGFPEVFAGKN
eukprot:m51a1_g1014 hypothetical protein (321) ;mRNA; f:615444-617931